MVRARCAPRTAPSQAPCNQSRGTRERQPYAPVLRASAAVDAATTPMQKYRQLVSLQNTDEAGLRARRKSLSLQAQRLVSTLEPTSTK